MGKKKSIRNNCDDVRAILTKRSSELANAQKEICRLEQESRNLRKTLEKTRQKADAALQAKNDFFTNISHEFRNPLTSVLGFSALLLKGAENNLTTEQKSLIEKINGSGKKLLEFVNDLLELSRFETGRIELLYSTVNLDSTIRGITEAAADKHNHPAAFFSVHADSTIHIDADRDRFIQAITILLEYSLRYSLANGTVAIHVERTPAAINDEGIGGVTISIDVSNPNLDSDSFRTFYSNISASDPKFLDLFNNAGAGFALCKKIARLHKGNFEIQSREDSGCRFVLLFPEKRDKPEVGAVFDRETSLLSWESFQQHMNRLISLCRRDNKNFGILRLDFSHIDDHGELLAITKMIKDCHREHEILASCGNWRECVYLMLWDADREVARNAIARIRNIAIERKKTVRIASLIYPEDVKSAAEILDKFRHEAMTSH